MPCGLFGKLLAKRDFISVNMPRDVLLGFEAWMQASLASSKNELSSGWLAAYMHAPLWRFWLGEEICGTTVKGVFMSSMDGVGRQFPLTVFTFPEDGYCFDPPSDRTDQDWFDDAEAFLLSTLDCPEDYDAVLSSLAALRTGQNVHKHLAQPVFSQHGARIAQGAWPTATTPEPLACAEGSRSGYETDPADAAAPSGLESRASISNEAVAMAGDIHDSADAGEAQVQSRTEDVSTDPVSDAATPSEDNVDPQQSAGVYERSQPRPVVCEMAPQQPVMSEEHLDEQLVSFGFAALEHDQRQRDLQRKSFWWTIGGHQSPPMAMIADGFPDPQLMTTMLTGLGDKMT